MKVPIGWLRDYVAVDAAPGEIAERLTFSGVEVEGIETVGSDWQGVVAGEILGVSPHPRADRLRLCRVADGRGELQVVCGADNFEVGDKVALACMGCTLPGGMKIRESKLRGEISRGMLCAEDELGLSDDHSGILLLPRETPAGTPLAEVLGPPETVLDLEITWNRPDCLSIAGIAREVAALFGAELRLPDTAVKESSVPVEDLAQVVIQAPDDCPRYTARVLQDVRIGPSPLWMQRRLSLCGVRPISNIVDVTNYVMLECGQPLHAFDYRLLSDRRIIVRRARPGESMATLDGTSRGLSEDMLVIADADQAVAVAGVMGGAGSEIRADTQTVLLESAVFSPPGIRRTSSRLGLSTESSHRFERGVDIGGAERWSRRAAGLMADLSGGSLARGVVDVYPGETLAREVSCRFGRLQSLVGVEVRPERAVSILASLELPVVRSDAESCTVSVPTFRPDIRIEADLIEEVARMVGLDQVPATVPQAHAAPEPDDRSARAMRACRATLIGLGLTEAMSYSFLSAPLLDMFGLDTPDQRVALPNPVSTDYAVMRSSLVPQLGESLARNLARQVHDVGLFEMGRVFLRNEKKAFVEQERVAIGLMGKMGRVALDRRRPVEAEEMFLWMKGILEALAAARRRPISFEPAESACLEPGWAVAVSADGVPCGMMGLLCSRIRTDWRMAEPVAVAEVGLAALCRNALDVPAARPVPAYPAVDRDLAVIVDESVTHARILQVIRAAAPKELTDVELFDIFRAEGIGLGRKSLAYSLVYRSLERTLTDEDANGFHDRIRNSLKQELNAEIRES